jgi:23S rRNA (adenine-N6)-dimethyltransferase
MFKTRRKLLSQNFLRDRELVKSLIRASGISWKDSVLEIGAGSGIITEDLLSLSRKVIAVEIDKGLYTLLSGRLGDNKSLELIYGNFLDFELPKEPYKVFSNIPFSITGEIIKKLLFSNNPPESCNLIVQKEAAEKFTVNQRKNSMLSILFYPWFEIKISHTFKRTDFNPIPNVDLCLLQIIKRPTSLIHNDDLSKYRDYVVFRFTKCRGVAERQPPQWLTSYTKDIHCRGSFLKWQKEQTKLEKIHRTRTDRNWMKYRR